MPAETVKPPQRMKLPAEAIHVPPPEDPDPSQHPDMRERPGDVVRDQFEIETRILTGAEPHDFLVDDRRVRSCVE